MITDAIPAGDWLIKLRRRIGKEASETVTIRLQERL